MMNHDKIYDKQVINVKTKKAKEAVFKAKSDKEKKKQFGTVTFKDNDNMTDKENNNDEDFVNHQDKNHKKRKGDTI